MVALRQQVVLGAEGQFRPRPGLFVVYLAGLLGIELLAEWLLAGDSPPIRALIHWSIVALAITPVFGLVAWRALQADHRLAAVAERDQVLRLVRQLTGAEEPREVAGLILRQLRELTHAKLAFLARPEGDGYVVDQVDGDVGYRLVGQQLQISAESGGIAGKAIRSRKIEVLDDTWSELGLASRRELALSDRVRSVAVVPLVMRGELVGLVALHAEKVGQIGPDTLRLIELYAEQAAGPLENAVLTHSVNQLDQARQLEQLKTEFLSAVAHELRAPLSPIIGWSELLLNHTYSAEQARPMLEHIHQGAQHMAVLVSDLLDLSRGEAGRLKLELDEVDLAVLIEDAVARWREQESEHKFVVAASGPLPLQGDRHRLRQVLDNLISNAAKYSPPGSRVFITARGEPNGRLVLRVSDQGLGMTREELQKVFTKFFRTDAARKAAPGTGLGLALCKLIVEAHGGEIVVESEGPGYGTAFTVALPTAGPPTQHGQAVASFAAVRG